MTKVFILIIIKNCCIKLNAHLVETLFMFCDLFDHRPLECELHILYNRFSLDVNIVCVLSVLKLSLISFAVRIQFQQSSCYVSGDSAFHSAKSLPGFLRLFN